MDNTFYSSVCWMGINWNKLWFQQREGLITASNFKAVIKTSLCMPAPSLIKKDMLPTGLSH